MIPVSGTTVRLRVILDLKPRVETRASVEESRA
jgi:hypothetical protein